METKEHWKMKTTERKQKRVQYWAGKGDLQITARSHSISWPRDRWLSREIPPVTAPPKRKFFVRTSLYAELVTWKRGGAVWLCACMGAVVRCRRRFLTPLHACLSCFTSPEGSVPCAHTRTSNDSRLLRCLCARMCIYLCSDERERERNAEDRREMPLDSL